VCYLLETIISYVATMIARWYHCQSAGHTADQSISKYVQILTQPSAEPGRRRSGQCTIIHLGRWVLTMIEQDRPFRTLVSE
jgi:hypothetical protein